MNKTKITMLNQDVTERDLREALHEELRNDLKNEFKKLKRFIVMFTIFIATSWLFITQLFYTVNRGGLVNWLLSGWVALLPILYGKFIHDEIK